MVDRLLLLTYSLFMLVVEVMASVMVCGGLSLLSSPVRDFRVIGIGSLALGVGLSIEGKLGLYKGVVFLGDVVDYFLERHRERLLK